MASDRERLDAIKAAVRNDKDTITIINEVGITIEDRPTIATPRPGYKWVPYQEKAGGVITWIEEADPTAQGTADNPIVFKVGMEVNENYYYTDGTKKYVCIKKGFPTELAEGEYFTEL
nr:MAG TPA: hypothetical protein [Caudoviricetes sp.]